MGQASPPRRAAQVPATAAASGPRPLDCALQRAAARPTCAANNPAQIWPAPLSKRTLRMRLACRMQRPEPSKVERAGVAGTWRSNPGVSFEISLCIAGKSSPVPAGFKYAYCLTCSHNATIGGVCVRARVRACARKRACVWTLVSVSGIHTTCRPAVPKIFAWLPHDGEGR